MRRERIDFSSRPATVTLITLYYDLSTFHRPRRPSFPPADIQRAPASPSTTFSSTRTRPSPISCRESRCRKTRQRASERASVFNLLTLIRNFSAQRSRVVYVLHLPRFRRKSKSALTAADRIALLRTRIEISAFNIDSLSRNLKLGNIFCKTSLLFCQIDLFFTEGIALYHLPFMLKELLVG